MSYVDRRLAIHDAACAGSCRGTRSPHPVTEAPARRHGDDGAATGMGPAPTAPEPSDDPWAPYRHLEENELRALAGDR